ncbi:MAG: winged helix-turn-helix domain-containing protein, partial [Rhizobiales bacterium]|nr:winged helix-turn-helix domain-containing protein [Hyphomicrobiales bacterium]
TQYRLSQRLARWLLMCQDRSDSAGIEMTHEFLSTMLSVRRAGVTEALNELEGAQLVRNSRGRVTVLLRPGLIEWAAGCYGVAEREYERLFPVIQKRCL